MAETKRPLRIIHTSMICSRWSKLVRIEHVIFLGPWSRISSSLSSTNGLGILDSVEVEVCSNRRCICLTGSKLEVNVIGAEEVPVGAASAVCCKLAIASNKLVAMRAEAIVLLSTV
jgi:hypothetical protein